MGILKIFFKPIRWNQNTTNDGMGKDRDKGQTEKYETKEKKKFSSRMVIKMHTQIKWRCKGG